MSSFRISRAVALILAVLCAALAFGQTSSVPFVTRVFTLTQTFAPDAIEAVATAVRGIDNLQQAPADAVQKTITVQGTAEQVFLADCLIRALDLAVLAAQPVQCNGLNGDQVRIVYAGSDMSQASLTEALQAARLMAGAQYAYSVKSANAVVVRGTPEQAEIVEWVVQTVSSAGPLPSLSQYPGSGSDVVQVVHLTNTRTALRLAEILNASRLISGVQQMMTNIERSDIVLRGSADQAALAYWLIQTLDKPSDWKPAAGLAIESYQYPESPLERIGRSVRVFILDPAYVQQGNTLLNAIRLATGTQIIMPVSSLPAIVMRGTEEQTSAAEGLMKERISHPAK